MATLKKFYPLKFKQLKNKNSEEIIKILREYKKSLESLLFKKKIILNKYKKK